MGGENHTPAPRRTLGSLAFVQRGDLIRVDFAALIKNMDRPQCCSLKLVRPEPCRRVNGLRSFDKLTTQPERLTEQYIGIGLAHYTPRSVLLHFETLFDNPVTFAIQSTFKIEPSFLGTRCEVRDENFSDDIECGDDKPQRLCSRTRDLSRSSTGFVG